MKRSTHTLRGALLAIGLSASARQAAAGTHIDSCRPLTQSGSCTRTKTLPAEGDCLVVLADFVTLDLCGHTSTGIGRGTGIRVDRQQVRQGIGVRHGTLTNCGNGVTLEQTSTPALGRRWGYPARRVAGWAHHAAGTHCREKGGRSLPV
jgi:hypothetical protein